jgi:hypothetical protein
MKKIISEREHTIPINRVIKLEEEKTKINGNYKIILKITHPKGFNQDLQALVRGGMPMVTIPRFIGDKRLQTNRITLKIWQDVPDEIPVKKETPIEIPKAKNPVPLKKKKTKFLSNIIDYHEIALKRSIERDEIIASKRHHVKESVALKPVGLDGLRILTADDCDYSRGVTIIQNLITALKKHNKADGITVIAQRKLLCEYYDVLSFSGASTIIGLYIALGEKAYEKGNLEAFLKWYQTELSKVYSPTSKGELFEKGKRFLQGMKPFKKMRKNPNTGFSLKNVEKIIGAFFTNENTGEPFRMEDLHCEVYQPLFLDDERTFVYSKAETPKLKLVDLVINTALDPNYFQTRKIEDMGISLGPLRRSFDLPLAQNNNNIELVSFGADLTYQESEGEFEGITPAQNSFLQKRKAYRIDHEDTQTYMNNNSHKVKYMRIESPQIPEVSENSVLEGDLIRCRMSAKDTVVITNGQKTLLTWS